MLLNKAIKKYLVYLENKNYANNTIKGYRKRLNILKEWLENRYNCQVYLDDILFDDINNFLNWQQKKGISGSSRNRDGYIISSFYKYLAKKDIYKNIAKRIEPVKTRTKEREYMTEKELEKVINAIEMPIIKIVTIFLYHTGCRISEALKLKINDVDFNNDIIKIKQAKGNKDRNLALNSELKTKLIDYLENERPVVDSKNVFATRKSGSLSRSHYNIKLKKATEKVDINKNITSHSIRHSTAVALVKKGVDLPTIQKILGHENLETTSIYVHSNMSKIRDALEVI